jgi:hypothetical protein
MARPLRLTLCALLGLTLLACGDDGGEGPPDRRDIKEKLESVPAIVSVTEGQVAPAYAGAGRRFFVLELEQPVDHFDPSAGTFRQTATLFYVSDDAPMVLAATGYDISRANVRSEPSALLEANQLLVEHRYFGSSIPDPISWEHLTVEQSAYDFHRIVEAVKPLFPGGWVNTGGSKGGMTSLYHRMFFPDDVDATIAYVAPNSLDATDDRYAAFVDEVFVRNGETLCLDKVRELQEAIIAHRQPVEALLRSLAIDFGDDFSLLGADRAEATARVLEFATVEAPFGLWQYSPNPSAACEALVTLSSNPDDFPNNAEAFAENLNDFFEITLGVSTGGVPGVVGWFGDEALVHYQSYYYQSATELGGPDYPMTKAGELLAGGIDDHPQRYPPLEPLKRYDAALMAEVQAWVSTLGERLLFVYGENDPWTAGAFEESAARDQARYTVLGAPGNHGAKLTRLPAAERDAALAKLRGWLGVATGAALTSQGALTARAAPAFDEGALLADRGSRTRPAR